MNDNYKETRAKYYQENKGEIRRQQKDYRDKQALDYYIIYYLPLENYCGITNCVPRMLSRHKHKSNLNTDGWRVLQTADTKLEALVIESRYHLELGMRGHNEITRELKQLENE